MIKDKKDLLDGLKYAKEAVVHDVFETINKRLDEVKKQNSETYSGYCVSDYEVVAMLQLTLGDVIMSTFQAYFERTTLRSRGEGGRTVTIRRKKYKGIYSWTTEQGIVLVTLNAEMGFDNQTVSEWEVSSIAERKEKEEKEQAHKREQLDNIIALFDKNGVTFEDFYEMNRAWTNLGYSLRQILQNELSL